MDTARDEFARHCAELLTPIGSVRVGRMFSGRGLYVDEVFVALIIADRLYLKTDATTRARFESEGSPAFSYEGKRGPVTTSYFAAPDDAMESPALMQPWARLALEAALRARAAKPRSAPRAKAARPRKTSAKATDTKP